MNERPIMSHEQIESLLPKNYLEQWQMLFNDKNECSSAVSQAGFAALARVAALESEVSEWKERAEQAEILGEALAESMCRIFGLPDNASRDDIDDAAYKTVAQVSRMQGALLLVHDSYRPYQEDRVRHALEAVDAALSIDQGAEGGDKDEREGT